MSVKNEHNNLVRLGDYIEEVALKVGTNNHIEISGINLEHGFIPTVADMNGIDTTKYKMVPVDCFACNLMHIGRDVKIPIAYNETEKDIAVSPAYYVFKIKENKKDKILGSYLEMLITRDEFGRLAWFHTDSSIRGNLLVSELCDILIPLPDIDIQQELVDTYNGLKALAEQNEALIKPLIEACQAYIVDCKKKYDEVELGGYIEESKEKNRELQFESKDARGVYSNGTFGDTLANLEGSNLASYKIVRNGEFAYSNRINIGSIAQCNEGSVIVSPSYTVFRVKSNEIISKYLFILFRRKEFLRSTLFFAIGTIKDDFSYERMSEVKIPKPPIEVQQAIVNLYNCAEEAKKIANEAREKMKTLCPALVQKALNG
jgi:type I restriction enzyme S subunit